MSSSVGREEDSLLSNGHYQILKEGSLTDGVKSSYTDGASEHLKIVREKIDSGKHNPHYHLHRNVLEGPGVKERRVRTALVSIVDHPDRMKERLSPALEIADNLNAMVERGISVNYQHSNYTLGKAISLYPHVLDDDLISEWGLSSDLKGKVGIFGELEFNNVYPNDKILNQFLENESPVGVSLGGEFVRYQHDGKNYYYPHIYEISIVKQPILAQARLHPDGKGYVDGEFLEDSFIYKKDIKEGYEYKGLRDFMTGNNLLGDNMNQDTRGVPDGSGNTVNHIEDHNYEGDVRGAVTGAMNRGVYDRRPRGDERQSVGGRDNQNNQHLISELKGRVATLENIVREGQANIQKMVARETEQNTGNRDNREDSRTYPAGYGDDPNRGYRSEVVAQPQYDSRGNSVEQINPPSQPQYDSRGNSVEQINPPSQPQYDNREREIQRIAPSPQTLASGQNDSVLMDRVTRLENIEKEKKAQAMMDKAQADLNSFEESIVKLNQTIENIENGDNSENADVRGIKRVRGNGYVFNHIEKPEDIKGERSGTVSNREQAVKDIVYSNTSVKGSYQGNFGNIDHDGGNIGDGTSISDGFDYETQVMYNNPKYLLEGQICNSKITPVDISTIGTRGVFQHEGEHHVNPVILEFYKNPIHYNLLQSALSVLEVDRYDKKGQIKTIIGVATEPEFYQKIVRESWVEGSPLTM